MYYASKKQRQEKAAHLLVGKVGEETAVRYLKGIGYEIRATNVRIERDEIDIVAFDPVDQVIAFVEVKTRTKFEQDDFRPEMTAGWAKRRKLKRSARRWVANHHYDGGYRIDLVCVFEGRVQHHFKELSWE